MGLLATTHGTTTRHRITIVAIIGLALAMIGVQAAIGATDNLPGGTAIEVTIDDPGEDTVIIVDDEDDLIDLTVTGTAEVGGAAVTKNTTLLYILDVSGSMRRSAGVDCTGNGEIDLRNTCQAEAVASVNSLATAPTSPVGFTGVGTYGSSGTVLDLDLASGANRSLVEPDYDGDGNGIPDIVDVVNGLPTTQGATNFSAGLDQALELLDSTPTSVARIVFISDGGPNAGDNVNTYVGRFSDPDFPGSVRIDSFAITSGAGCDNAGSSDQYGSLDDIAGLGTTAGTCTEVEDLSNLNFVLGQVLSSELSALTGSVDGGEAVAITDVTPALPEEGPANVDYTWNVGELGIGEHEVCVTATGSDGGGEGSVAECRTVTISDVEVLSDGLYPPEPDVEVLGEALYPPDVSAEAAAATPIRAEPDFTG